MQNRLVNSTSPYLRQHADNPVDWYPWGKDALNKAKEEDKPIFLSIGYAACHWCHVMAHESFENSETAAIMNKFFVNIKVDREERPDLDSIYMSATVAMTGSGGWPMSVFLTPDLKPFYAGTYFPPTPRHNLPSFTELLLSLADAWSNRRDEIDSISERMLNHLKNQSTEIAKTSSFTNELLDKATDKLVTHYDWNNGGWGAAPKFPQPMTIEFLLRRHLSGDARALKPAIHALKAMARGGMYDVVGGGFSRYSVDQNWRVPHFEKMLYDNALLSRAYLHAWLVTGEPSFSRICEETLSFVLRELTSSEGGFYSSLDADSEGEEGKFYVWARNEILDVLGDDSEFFLTAYGVTDQGNWEGKTILQRALDNITLASHFNIEMDEVSKRLHASHKKLLSVRDKRIRPATDDKVITAWNGLMLAAFAEAARYIGKDNYLSTAIQSAEFLLNTLRPNGNLKRSWRVGQTSNEVFLEDYGALILGLIELYQTDFQNRWFLAAEELAEEMVAQFWDQSGGFFDTPVNSEKLLLRPKDLQDNATPSGNALAVDALLKLASFNGNDSYLTLAENALAQVTQAAIQYPTAFARWLSNADFSSSSIKQVAVIGEKSVEDTNALLEVLNQEYRPNMVLAVSHQPLHSGKPALLADRSIINGKPTAYVCEGFTCKLPVNTPDELLGQLNS